MTSRLARTARYAVGTAAPAAAYLYTHPEAREPTLMAAKETGEKLKTAAALAAPIIKSAIYVSPSIPTTQEEEVKYLTDFGMAIEEAKNKYGGDKTISKTEIDNLLKEVFDRAAYYATQKGYKTIPTTVMGADNLYADVKKTWTNTAKEWTSWFGQAASKLIPGASKPLQGGRRKSRRHKRSSKRSRRNRK